MKATPLINNFTSGEWSPLLRGRSDLEQYSHSAERIENILVTPYGGVTKIPGTRFVAPTKDSESGASIKKVRLLPFEFNVIQAYILEFGNQYIRFYMNHGQITTFDEYFKFLCHCDGLDASTSFVDEIGTHTITAHGDAQVDTEWKRFGTGSLLLPTEGSYISFPEHADVNFGTGRFTIEFCLKFDEYEDRDSGFFQQRDDEDNLIQFFYENWLQGEIKTYQIGLYVRSGGVTLISEVGSWIKHPTGEYHIALIRGWGDNDNAWAITVDGQVIKTWTASITMPDLSEPFEFGRYYSDEEAEYHYTLGRKDEICISKGKARWIATFQPPTLEYPLGGGGVTYELDDGDGVTYLEADLPYLQFTQDADIMYIVHSSYPPKELSRLAHDSWTLTDYIPQKGPLLPVNLDVDSTITPTADSGAAITLTATKDIFDYPGQGQVGNFVWRIKSGYVKITAVADTKHATADVMYGGNLGTGPAATDDWAEAAWSAYRGYPGAVTLYEQRLCFASSSYKPQTIWCSVSGNHELMLLGAADADALIYTLATREVIKWISGDILLYAGTTGGVFHVSSGDTAYPLTPTNVVVRKHTNFGCNYIPPVRMGNLLYYVQRNNLTLREYVYEYSKDIFLATDATLLAEHILKPEVIDIGYQQSPYNLLYCVRSDGEVAIFTRNLIQKVMGWGRFPDSGKVESVVVISRATGGDEVWFVFNRTVGGVTKRYIEYMEQFSFVSQEDAFFVRSGLSYSGEPVSTVSGLDHLIEEEVAILGDGAVFPNDTVDENGEVTLSVACSKIHIGLPYEVKLTLQKLETGSALGTAQTKIQRIAQLGIKFYRSSGCSFGVEGKMDVLPFRSTDMEMDAPPDLFTGERVVIFPKGYGRDIKISVWQNQPLPLTILSMVAFAETHEG